MMLKFLHHISLAALLHKRGRTSFFETHLPPPLFNWGIKGTFMHMIMMLLLLTAWLVPDKANAIDRHEGFEVLIKGAVMEFAYVNRTAKTVELACANLPADSIVVIPSSVEYEGVTYRVTTIANTSYSVSLLKGAKKITIEEGIEKLGTDFCRINIAQSLRIPSTIKEIPADAFQDITIDTIIWDTKEEVTIGDYAFRRAKFNHFVLPENTTEIGSGAFAESNIKSVTLPKGFKNMAATNYVNPFFDCQELVEIKSESPNYEVIDGVLYTSTGLTLICYPASKKESTFNMPSSVTRIAQKAFYRCNNLTTVNFNENCMSIEKEAFYNCINLATVNFNDHLNRIDASSFQYCRMLKSVALGRDCEFVRDYAFANSGITSVILNKNLRTIGTRAFARCSELSSVTVDGYDASNSALNSAGRKLIVLPKKLRYLGDEVFVKEYENTVERPKESWLIALRADYLDYFGGQRGDTVFIYGNGTPKLAITGYAVKTLALYIPFDQYDYYNALYKENERSRPLKIVEYAPIFFNNTIVTENNYKNIVWNGMSDGASASYDIASKTLN